MSSPLWIGPRSYPAGPGLVAISRSSATLRSLALYVALFVLAAAGAGDAGSRDGSIAAFLAIMAAFCLTDQTRWQPWVFQYSLLLADHGAASWNGADAGGEKRALNILRLIVAFTYIYSGLQKINLNFMDE